MGVGVKVQSKACENKIKHLLALVMLLTNYFAIVYTVKIYIS